MALQSKSHTVGIDLGTTFSAVAVVDEHGSPQLIADQDSVRLVPSVLLFEENGNVLVGRVAKQFAVAQPDRTVEFVKREMGKSVENFSRTFDGSTYGAEELSALILKKLKQQAENALGFTVESAVITVPAYFNDNQRSATKRAGWLAGLSVERLLDEPVAAAIASGVDDKAPEGRFLVFDLGGGTLDVSVVQKAGTRLDVLATEGDHQLGGKDFDDCLITYGNQKFEEKFGFSVLTDLAAYQDLQTRANQAKEALTQKMQVPLLVQCSGQSLKVDCSRELFESLARTLLARCNYMCERTLESAGCKWSSLQMILLVGGSTRMPMVQTMLREISSRPVASVLNPDEAVALGAAIVAAASAENSASLPPATLELATRVRDCTAHSLGTIVKDSKAADALDIYSVVIQKGSAIGKTYGRDYYTLHDNQTVVCFNVLEGESLDTGNEIGECLLSGIPPSPAGRPVHFELCYNADHRLTATGRDVLTGRNETVEIRRLQDRSPQDLAESKSMVAIRTVE